MSLRMALLGLLTTKGPASGYALTRAFSDTLSHVWSAKHSQVYPELARMADAGLIAVEDEGPRGRKRYSVTDAGREELRHWLTDVEPSRTVRNETALRAFLMPTLGPEPAARLARTEETYYRQRAEQLGELRAMLTAVDPPLFGSYAAELGVRISHAIADWAQWAAEQMESEEDPPQDPPQDPSQS